MNFDDRLNALLYPDGNLTSDPERIAEYHRLKRERNDNDPITQRGRENWKKMCKERPDVVEGYMQCLVYPSDVSPLEIQQENERFCGAGPKSAH